MYTPSSYGTTLPPQMNYYNSNGNSQMTVVPPVENIVNSTNKDVPLTLKPKISHKFDPTAAPLIVD
jgi:hypothetical protein